jgi:NADPH-dependent curcumin reductase CurA
MCTPVTQASPEAAALVLSGVTAAASLYGTAAIKPGQTVVVTAAAGGTGHFAVQLAKLAGCRVVAVCGGQVKGDRLLHLSAAPDYVVDYTSEVRTHLPCS